MMVKVKFLLVLFCLLWLGGCTPEYNWRELTVADERAMVMFPSRVKTEQRPIRVDGIELIFSLTSAAVDQSVFSDGASHPGWAATCSAGVKRRGV